MPYVSRDSKGNISGAFHWEQPGLAEELLQDSDPALVAFLAPPAVPQAVSPLQARRALRQAGLIDIVNSSVAAAEAASPGITDAWQYASLIWRDDPFVALLAPKLNLTAAAIDHLFILAATL